VAEELESGDACAARASADRLQARTIAAVNSGRVPPRYQEELTASVSALVGSISCTITPPTTPETAVPEEDEEAEDEEEDGEDEDEDDDGKKSKGKKKGKKGKKG